MKPRAAVARGLFGLLLLATLGLLTEFTIIRPRTAPIDSERAIHSLEQQRIGGVEQWILIRGHDRSKPILLFLHGGPGMPMMFLAHAFQRELEREFIVVHWDRRGAGKSFDAFTASPHLSVSQTLGDTLELTQHLRRRFDQERIFLVGHSWGSYLGLLAVRAHPEYYAAYIGTGQIAGTRSAVDSLRREFLLDVGARNDDASLIARASDPAEPIREDDLFRAGAELHAARSFWPLLLRGLGAREYSLADILNVKKGADRVSREMQYDVRPLPLKGEVGSLRVPVFLLLGRHDFNTPSPLAAEYLGRVNAPMKKLVWFERSAHFPFLEQPERFTEELIRIRDLVSYP